MSAPIKSAELKRSELLAKFLDSSIPIPGTNYRVGFDPLLGLIPVIGDSLALILGSIIVLDAARLGVSNVCLFRMMSNLVLDSLLSAVPFFGDIADFFYRSNQANLNLLKNAELDPARSLNPGGRVVRVAVVLLTVIVLCFGVIVAGAAFSLLTLLNLLSHS